MAPITFIELALQWLAAAAAKSSAETHMGNRQRHSLDFICFLIMHGYLLLLSIYFKTFFF